jgi:DNA/RNA-binding domain of Phe-tRNA-synthetase-like protein
MGQSDEMVKECPGDSEKAGVHCELWPYRFGRNPNITEETRRKRRMAAQAQGFTRKREKEPCLSAQNPLSLAGEG